jgi:hypothetical protein
MEDKEQHQIHIRGRSAALINSDDTGGFKIVRENVRENIKILVGEILACYTLGDKLSL